MTFSTNHSNSLTSMYIDGCPNQIVKDFTWSLETVKWKVLLDKWKKIVSVMFEIRVDV